MSRRERDWSENVLGILAIGGMILTVPLGFLSWRTGPVPHGALAILACILSIIAHVRRGGGGDLGASLLLGLGVFLGVGVPDGVVGAGIHAAVSIAGVAFSTWVHLGHLRQAAHTARAAPRPPARS